MAATRIAYITDIEGNYHYYTSFVNLSEILTFVDINGVQNLDFKEDNTIFVFGGDASDKGNGSIRITRQLVSFKKRYPTRVFLIMGNRDINKMRWTSELEKTEIENLENVPGPYWVKKEARISPKDFLEKKLADPTNTKTLADYNTVPNRINWMLESTMGSAGDFERRRQELAILGAKKKTREITDDEVAKSYMESVKPASGETFQLLQLGQLAYIHGETLFVHGGINKDNIGYIPFNNKKIYNIHEWVHKLNEWYKSQVEEWIMHPKWSYENTSVPFTLGIFKKGSRFDPSIQGVPESNEYENKLKWNARGGHRLMDYSVPTTVGSVVYANMFNRFNNCQPADPEVSKQLIDSNIRRLVTGHQPHGNAPAISKSDDLEHIDADSSYSDMSVPDNRGRAVSEVIIEARRVRVTGVLHDGTPISYSVSLVKGEGDPFVGRKVPGTEDADGNSFWVKAKYTTTQADGKDYLLCKIAGYKVGYDQASLEKLEELFYGKSLAKAASDIKSINFNGKPIKITKSEDVDFTLSEIVKCQFFDDWKKKIENSGLILESVHIQSVDNLNTGLQIRFIKLKAVIKDKEGRDVSGVIFLRGDSVAVLCVLTTEEGKRYVVTIKHHRAAIGVSDFLEIPIGLAENSSPFGVIHNLLQAESGLELVRAVTINLSDVLFKDPNRVFYMSPGACDQGVRFFLIESDVTHRQIEEVCSKSRTDLNPYETVIVPLEELEGRTQDANSIIAARLYDLYNKKRERNELSLSNSNTPLPVVVISPPSSPLLSPSSSPSLSPTPSSANNINNNNSGSSSPSSSSSNPSSPTLISAPPPYTK